MKIIYTILLVLIVALAGTLIYRSQNQFPLPEGETTLLEENSEENSAGTPSHTTSEAGEGGESSPETITRSSRQIMVTDGTKHSIPLNEILAGGPPKDGIPSIDNPKFISTAEADGWLGDEEVGLGISIGGESRFYPFQILVFHEIVNDEIAGKPVLVTYCPLCFTGIVFERKVSGQAQEFGVSGRLWQSNLLMYNRAPNPANESLWSQVLGEAVVGPNTGEKLKIVPSSIVKYGEWKDSHPETKVLSRDTGISRNYGRDPYGDYYTNEQVSFGASFSDDRLHPKEFVLGVEVNGVFKAYPESSLPIGETQDTIGDTEIKITKNQNSEIEMFRGPDLEPLPYIGGFWFSWLAVHPDTLLYEK